MNLKVTSSCIISKLPELPQSAVILGSGLGKFIDSLDKPIVIPYSEILHNYRDEYRVLVRWSKGQDIAAGCGQLAGQKK